MDFIEYVSWMFSAGTVASYIALGVAGFFLLSVLSELLAGLKRGVRRQIAHIIFTAIAFTLSFFVTEYLVTEIHTAFESYTLGEMLSTAGVAIDSETEAIIGTLDNNSGSLPELILTPPFATVIAPILFTVFFYIINLVLKIVCFIVTRFIKKPESASARVSGLILGAVEGLLVATLVCVPVVALADLTAGAYEEIADGGELNEEFDELYTDYIAPLKDHPCLALTKVLGGEAIIKSFATVDVGYGDIDMRDEVYSAARIFSDIASLAETDWSKLNEQDKETLTALIGDITSSEFFSEAFVGFFGILGDMFSEDGSNPLVQEGDSDLLAAILNDIIAILGTTSKDTIADDLNTFKNMFFILSDGDVLIAFNEGMDSDNMLSILNSQDAEGDTVVSKLIDTLQANKRTAPLVTTITKLSVTIMAEQMGMGEDAEQIYESVTDGLKDIADIDRDSYASEQEYKAAVKESINDTLLDAGIELDDKVVGDMADYAADNYGELEQLTEEEINDILLQYYNSIMNK